MNIIKTLYRSCSRVSDMIDKVLKVILVLLVLGSALDLFLQDPVPLRSGAFCQLLYDLDK